MNSLGPLFGMDIKESALAVTFEPRRSHKKRKWMSAAYHKRIQKKWNKRFGRNEIPGCWVIDTGLLGVGSAGKVLVVHPKLLAQMKSEMKAQIDRSLYAF